MTWGHLGTFRGRLRGVLGSSCAPNPKKSEGDQLWEVILESVRFRFGGESWSFLGTLGGVAEGIFASHGASWACLTNKFKKYMNDIPY